MQTQINLAPQEVIPKSSQRKIDYNIKIFAAVFTVAFFISILTVFALNTQKSLKIKNLTGQNDAVKTEILALKRVEQQYVFFKDRLGKIREARESSDIDLDLNIILEIYGTFPDGVNMSQAEIDDKDTKITISANNGKLLSQILSTLVSYDFYKEITLESLNLNKDTGYNMQFTLGTGS